MVQPNPRVQVWDLGVKADAPLHHWMLAIGEVGEKVEEVAYTDGSKAPDGLVRAGFVIREGSWHRTLLRHSTVYEGEVVAVVVAVKKNRASKMLVLTDCQSVVKAVDGAIGDSLPTGGAVGEIWSTTGDKEVALGWVKAQVGVPGNEAADVAAKRGAGMDEGTRVMPEVDRRTVAQSLAARRRSRYRHTWGGEAPLGGAGRHARRTPG